MYSEPWERPSTREERDVGLRGDLSCIGMRQRGSPLAGLNMERGDGEGNPVSGF